MSAFIPAIFSNPADADIDDACSPNTEIGTQNLHKIFEIADKLKSQKYTSKQVLLSIKRKLQLKNPNVQSLAIDLIDALVKNCGSSFHKELVQKDILDSILLIIQGENTKVKNQALKLVEFCAKSFTEIDLSYMSTIHKELLSSGYKFPNQVVNSSLIETTLVFITFDEAAPWIDSNFCMRCRKHHCRLCGMVFCQDCSSKIIPIERLGLIEPVRVCDGCHQKESNSSGGSHDQQVDRSMIVSKIQDANLGLDTDLEKAIQESLRLSTAIPLIPKNTYSKEDDELTNAIQLSLQESKSANQNIYEDDRRNRKLEEQRDERIEGSIAMSNNVEPSTKLSKIQKESILLFSESIEKTEKQIIRDGIQSLNPFPIQTSFAQVSSLHPLLSAQLQDCAEAYRKTYDLNVQINEVIHQYDTYLQQRFQFSSRTFDMQNQKTSQGGIQNHNHQQQYYSNQPSTQNPQINADQSSAEQASKQLHDLNRPSYQSYPIAVNNNQNPNLTRQTEPQPTKVVDPQVEPLIQL